MLQAFVQNVSSVSDVCCKCFNLDIAYVSHICCNSMFQLFQLCHSYVAVSVFMLQMFYIDVAYVLTRTLQVYVLNVSSASDVCCI